MNTPKTLPPQAVDLDVTYRKLSVSLKSYFLKRVRDADLAEDLVQEVFVRLSRSPRQGAGDHPEAYIFFTAANILRDRYRRAKVAGDRVELSVYELEMQAEHPLPDRTLSAKQDWRRMVQAISALPRGMRTALLLHRFEDMTYAQVAAHMRISVSAVEKHIACAVMALRRALATGE